MRLLALIAGLILVIASINFMNLFTAKASRRVKEVGIRKALGASRAALVGQYLTESVVMALLALVVAVGLVQLVLPQFSELTGKPLALRWEPQLVGASLALALGTGLLAGSYPAFYLSGFQPAAVLKGKLPTRAGDVWTRQGLGRAAVHALGAVHRGRGGHQRAVGVCAAPTAGLRQGARAPL